MEIDPQTGSIVKSYIHSNGQILAQHDGPHTAAKYFYLHDRLGSVRQVINSSGSVVKYCTFEPFGRTIESGGTFNDPFGFTGQYLDAETGEYHLRARQYNPTLARFTARDPIFGKLEQPLTLHKYLYCANDPINAADPHGLWTIHITGTAMASIGGSVVRQSGITFDDKGNWAWINLTGVGVGVPTVSAGVSIGFTTADTVYDLARWAGSFGTSVSIPQVPLLSGGVDYIRAQGFWGLQANFSGSIPDYIPWEYHYHQTYTSVYSFEMLREAASVIIDEAIYDVKTLGQWYALSIPYGLVETMH